ncbi:serine/threonine-protein phosphatase 6 regulatory subunit 2-like isoform X3 [Daphnia magna]|uniref:serine/threonine-protein phosphatase 6 regulatory subunit 2-like isoform X3 n=1 Tax=Daphnia magna TaxID=35525 RepID=UPI001E1BDBD2|nr:serine/threonine-protein phosphatase 6 regulatory subunit 2-like isoform X3 [Daphnia magna]
MFWRFNNMCTTNIDNLLNDEDVTLQRLMDEDDIIQECKSSNRKLVNFLVKSEVLHELVSLVTKEPSTQTAEVVRFKYNNIAAELLSCDIAVINDAIVTDDVLLSELCQFICNEPPLNPLMASFFSKTMAVLVGRKAEKMLQYLKPKEGFLSQLLKHLGTSAIMDLVLKLVTCVENKNSRLEIAQWLYSEHFVENLLGLLSEKTETDLHGNAAQLLCDLLRLLRDMHAQNLANEMSTEQTHQGETVEVDPILCALESKAMVDRLLGNMLDSQICESSIVHGITVLLTLLEVRRPPQLLSSEPEVYDRFPPDPVVTSCIRNTVEALIPRLKDFHQILSQPPQEKNEGDIAVSACNKPFGFVRLQVTRLFAALIATGSSEVQNELASLHTFPLLLDMMVEFSHNNFLHAQVERSVQYVLGLEPIDLLQPSTQLTVNDCSLRTEHRTQSEQPTSSTHCLLSYLMIDMCIVRRIMDAWELNDQHEIQQGGHRKGYMGHLIRMANYVMDFGKQGKNAIRIQELMQDLPEELRVRWNNFVENKVTPAIRNNEIIPVTSHMVAPRVSSDEEESDLIRVPKDTAAQEMEVMTKPIVTQFGFADSQFNDSEDQLRPQPETLANIALPQDGDELTQQSELFEQVCNERMHTRPKTLDGDDDAEDNETWLQSRRRSSENASTVRPEFVSDEENTIADVANDSMDIDSLDPWASDGDSGIPVAADAGNPWESVPTCSAGEEEEQSWANFSKADFDNPAGTTPMEVSDSPSAGSAENLPLVASTEPKFIS